MLQNSFIIPTIFLVTVLFPSCEKNDNSNTLNTIQSDKKGTYTSEKGFVGTWVEKYPQQFDGISDTIVFNPDSTVSKYFLFNSWGYRVKNDSIQFINPTQGRNYSFHFTPISDSEIVINNFIDRLATAQVKDIHYIRK